MNKKLANISIVIPALNEESNLTKCLDSILIQTLLPKQVILIDHNSTDNTPKIAQSYNKKFKQLKVDYKIIKETKKGIANARNKGWNIASQPIIASLDADCIAHKDWIKNIDLFFKNNKDVIAVTGKIIHYDSILIWKLITEKGYYGLMHKIMSLVNNFHSITTSNCAVQKQAFKKVGGFDKQILLANGLDDVELASRLSLVGQIKYNQNVIVYSSFRRYHNYKKAIESLIHRFRSMKKIKANYKKLLNS